MIPGRALPENRFKINTNPGDAESAGIKVPLLSKLPKLSKLTEVLRVLVCMKSDVIEAPELSPEPLCNCLLHGL